MPQFARFVRKREDYLHISLEVLKGLSSFWEAFGISGKRDVMDKENIILFV